jgi:hypothetical protein
LQDPALIVSGLITESVHLYLDEIFDLARMSYELIGSSANLDEIFIEYETILKKMDIRHQFIRGISSNNNILGCIDPIYRRGKPLKYLMDSRHMILAMCKLNSLSNIAETMPNMVSIKMLESKLIENFTTDKIEMLPLTIAHQKEGHFTYRPSIDFIGVDTFGPLQSAVPNQQQQVAAQLNEIVHLIRATNLAANQPSLSLPIPAVPTIPPSVLEWLQSIQAPTQVENNARDPGPSRQPQYSTTDTRLSSFFKQMNQN